MKSDTEREESRKRNEGGRLKKRKGMYEYAIMEGTRKEEKKF